MEYARNAEIALKAWDSGEPVAVFRVESEGATQEEIWGAAFESIRDGSYELGNLSPRERDVVKSILFVSAAKGWASMIESHISPSSPAVTITKPKPS